MIIVGGLCSIPDDEALRYVMGITLNIRFAALGMTISLSMSAYYRWEMRDGIKWKVEDGKVMGYYLYI